MGDPVCVTQDEYNEVAGDTAAAASNYLSSYNYTQVSTVPYGVCNQSRIEGGYYFKQYRQSYMGDYVCVLPSHANNIKNQNANLSSRVQACRLP